MNLATAPTDHQRELARTAALALRAAIADLIVLENRIRA